MLKKIFIIFILLIVMSPTFHAHAIDFEAETVYKSVVVIYSGNYMGSGFAIGQDCIITNAHVIDNVNDVTISVYQDNIYKAEVIKLDQSIDLAVLKIIGKTLPYLKTYDENNIIVGSDVYAIGAPQDMEYTLTKGILSAKNRKIGNYNYLQTDAPINEGNSGGPLLSVKGEVIGVNTMKMKDSEGLGIAIPITKVIEFLQNNDITIGENGEVNIEDSRKDNNEVSEETQIVDSKETEIANLKGQVFHLKILVALLVILEGITLLFLIIFILKLIKKRNKIDRANSYDFEIDIEE